MAKVISDGITRLQAQSRIPAATWRQWCTLLKLEPADAVEVWEEICYPIMLATRKVPEITYILQLRAERLTLDIFDFKEEIAKVLHFFTFLFNLQDEQLVRGKLKTALVKFYKHVGTLANTDDTEAFTERFINDLCAMVLVAKVIDSDNITLSGVLKTVGEGRGTLEQVARLANKSVNSAPYGELVQDYFNHIGLFAPPNGPVATPDAAEDIEEEEPTATADNSHEAQAVDAGEDEEEEENNDSDPEDAAPDELDPLEESLVKFKTALHTIYQTEAEIGREAALEDMEEQIDALLDTRIQVIARFMPLQSTIPSVEEAQEIARRAEISNSRPRIHRTTAGGIASFTASLASANEAAKQQALRSAMSGSGSSGGGSGSVGLSALGGSGDSSGGGGGGGGRAAKDKDRPTGSSTDPDAAQDALRKAEISDRVDMDDMSTVSIEAEDIVDVPEIYPSEFSDRVRLVATFLSSVENSDQTAWQLVLDPAAHIDKLAGFARTLSMESTPAHQAYVSIKAMAQCLPLKPMLTFVDKAIQRDRNFSIQVTTFVNQINHIPATKEITPDSRQLAPLKTILDHASAALLRLEAVKTNYTFIETRPSEYTTEATMVYYEEALRGLTDLTDRELLKKTREKADADTASLFAHYQNRQYTAGVIDACCTYAAELVAAGHTASIEQINAVIADQPIQLAEGPEGPDPGALPAPYTVPSDQGERFDAVAQYLYAQAWQVLRPTHQPEACLERLQQALRQALVSVQIVRPERKRHVDNSRLPIAVIRLDKLSGNANLKSLYVRANDEGHLQYVEGYEDGTYVDIFELREYKPMRMQGNAQQKAAAEGTDALQTGHKYLYTAGRTNKLFGDSPNQVINNCVRKDDGSIHIFPIFH